MALGTPKAISAVGVAHAVHGCTSDGALPNPVGSQDDGGASSSGSNDGGVVSPLESGSPDGNSQGAAPDAGACPYADDATFCACMGWNCGGTTVTAVKTPSGDLTTV